MWNMYKFIESHCFLGTFVGMDNAHDEIWNENSWFVLITHVERYRMDRREREGERQGVEGEVGNDFNSNNWLFLGS